MFSYLFFFFRIQTKRIAPGYQQQNKFFLSLEKYNALNFLMKKWLSMNIFNIKNIKTA